MGGPILPCYLRKFADGSAVGTKRGFVMKEIFGKRNWITLLVFGIAGQIAWSVENMYFNLFVFDEMAGNLDAVTLMVQLSGIVATVITLVAGTLSDKIGNRRRFIYLGYIFWGISVALFGCLTPEVVGAIFSLDEGRALAVATVLVIVADCIMTMFGSSANDAAFNAWLTDNTRPSFRGTVEGVVAILPLFSMLAVVGGFGHGFLTLTDDVEFCYKVDNLYSRECDRGIRFDDAEIGVEWGIDAPVLSEKDTKSPHLCDSDCNFIYGEV